MAKYRIETSKGTFEVEADREPTIDDVEAALAQQGTKESTPAEPEGTPRVENVLGNPYTPKINDRPLNSTGDPSQNIVGFTKHVADNAMESGGATAGQVAGAPLAPATFGLSIPIGGAIGGGIGNIAAQTRRIQSGDQQKFSYGDLGATMLTSMVPGGSELKGGMKLVKEGMKNVATNVGAQAVRTGIDEHRLPTAQEAELAAAGGVAGTAVGKVLNTDKSGKAIAGLMEQDAAENAIIQTAKDAGYVLPPSKINPNAVNAGADFLAGDSAVSNDFSLRNQRVTNSLARKYIKLPENATLNDKNISQAVAQAKQPYDELRALSPQADANIDGLLQAKADANRAWKAYNRLPTPEVLKVATENDALADMFHDELVTEATNAGMANMEKRLQKAKVDLAKIHMVEVALGPDGNVSAKAFSRAGERGVPLTDEGKVIADTAYTFPTVTKDKRSIGAIGSGKIPILDKYVRAGMANDKFQDRMATPRYDDPTMDPASNFARLGTMLFTQEDSHTEQARNAGPSFQYLLRNPGR